MGRKKNAAEPVEKSYSEGACYNADTDHRPTQGSTPEHHTADGLINIDQMLLISGDTPQQGAWLSQDNNEITETEMQRCSPYIIAEKVLNQEKTEESNRLRDNHLAANQFRQESTYMPGNQSDPDLQHQNEFAHPCHTQPRLNQERVRMAPHTNTQSDLNPHYRNKSDYPVESCDVMSRPHQNQRQAPYLSNAHDNSNLHYPHYQKDPFQTDNLHATPLLCRDRRPAPHSSNERQHMTSHYQQHRRQKQSNGGDVKIPPFTGKEDWTVWINRLEVIAERYQWEEEELIDHLLPKLQGHAGDFVFTQLPRWKLFDYGALKNELDSQFKKIETQRSMASKFSKRDQRNGETAEEYAAELKRLYAKAYQTRDSIIKQEDLVRRFLEGLRDSEARFEVEFHKDPQTIDEAVFQVVRFMQTRQGRDREPYSERKMKKFTRQAYEEEQFDDHSGSDEDLFDENVEARVCRDNVRPTKQVKVDKPTQPIEQTTNPMQAVLMEVLAKLNQLAGAEVKPPQKKKTEYVCYFCGEAGHFIRDCPKKSEQTRQDKSAKYNNGGRQSKYQHQQEKDHLNY